MRTNILLRAVSVSFAVSLAASLVVPGRLSGQTLMAPNTISITSVTPDTFFLNSLTVQVPLRHTVAGLTATHYRVSHFSDFRDAQWITYVPTPSVTTASNWFTLVAGNNSMSSTIIYFQLRARNPNAGKPVSLTSGGLTVQPDFINSNIRNKTIKVTFAG
jgi:hypothetical protein